MSSKSMESVGDSGAFAPDLMEAISPGSPGALLGLVRDRIRRKHYGIRTEEAYCEWIKRFIPFHGSTVKEDLLLACRAYNPALSRAVSMSTNRHGCDLKLSFL